MDFSAASWWEELDILDAVNLTILENANNRPMQSLLHHQNFQSGSNDLQRVADSSGDTAMTRVSSMSSDGVHASSHSFAWHNDSAGEPHGNQYGQPAAETYSPAGGTGHHFGYRSLMLDEMQPAAAQHRDVADVIQAPAYQSSPQKGTVMHFGMSVTQAN